MMPWDMTRLDPPPSSATMSAREQLDLFRAMAQFRLSMVALGIYFVVLIIFLVVLRYIAQDNQLTIAVLLLQPVSILIGSLGAFWLQRSSGQEPPAVSPSVTTTATTGQTTTTIGAAPATALPPVPAPPGSS